MQEAQLAEPQRHGLARVQDNAPGRGWLIRTLVTTYERREQVGARTS